MIPSEGGDNGYERKTITCANGSTPTTSAAGTETGAISWPGVSSIPTYSFNDITWSFTNGLASNKKVQGYAVLIPNTRLSPDNVQETTNGLIPCTDIWFADKFESDFTPVAGGSITIKIRYQGSSGTPS